uniref:Uncharacterized protein n=1 Tax=Amphimedon queenslandica TaxID=400682 RepID=A0A1X7VQG5_AMPQE
MGMGGAGLGVACGFQLIMTAANQNGPRISRRETSDQSDCNTQVPPGGIIKWRLKGREFL